MTVIDDLVTIEVTVIVCVFQRSIVVLTFKICLFICQMNTYPFELGENIEIFSNG